MSSSRSRFTVKRVPHSVVTATPWRVLDRERPAFVGQYATYRLALAAVDARVALEYEMEHLEATA